MEQYLKDLLRNAVARMEGATGDPYKPVFAGGISGMSFGRMQNDVAANRDASRTFYNALRNTKTDTGLSDFDIVKTTLAAMTPGMTGERLEREMPGTGDKLAQALRLSHAAVDARVCF